MLKKILAVVAMLYAAMAFAAVDVNKATPAELDGVKGIGPAISGKIVDERKKGSFKDWQDFIDRVKGVGEGNAAKFSAEGLTVNGSAFKGAAAAPAAKTAETKASATAMAKEEKKDAKATAKEEKKAAKATEKQEKKAADAKAKEDKKAADAKAKEAKKSAEAKKDTKDAKADAKDAKADAKADAAKPAASAAKAASAKK